MTLTEKLIITTLLLITVNVFFWGIIYPAIKYSYMENKQSKCFHLWRCMDADYSGSEPLYRYRCAKCKSDKQLLRHECKQFEKDFLSDWYEHEEE